MSWATRIFEVPESTPHTEGIESLFRAQVAEWPLLRAGITSLGRSSSREFSINEFTLIARHIPHRIQSTTARVDPKSILERPCFLCCENLPPEERGIFWGGDFVILCNPFPILDRHVSVVSIDHNLQRIAGRFGTMLDLARSLPGYIVLYNGPECGASAPDHMHFQAAKRDELPIVRALERVSEGLLVGYPPTAFVLHDSDQTRIDETFWRLIACLEESDPNLVEPMINLVVFSDAGSWTAIVFPRSKHRPEIYHTGELTWSPASIDLCGVIVLPVPSDLQLMTASRIEQVFGEVSMPPNIASRIARRLEFK